MSLRANTETIAKDGPKQSMWKLERMKMPTFNGNIRDFPRFKSDFEDLVMPSLESSDRAAYILRTCLLGEALHVVRNVDNDLNQMWTRLNDRFGRASKLADAIMNDIKIMKPVADYDERGFVKLVNLVENSYTDLVRIKMEQEIANSTIVGMIEERLSKSIKTQWCIKVCDEDGGVDERNKFPQFLEFILKHKRAVEYGYSNLRSGVIHRQGSVNMGQGTTNRQRENCWIHNNLEVSSGEHPIWKCREFIGMKVDERLSLVKSNKACLACLLVKCPGASSPECCTFNFKCREKGCGQRHNQLLHKPTTSITGATNHALDQPTHEFTQSDEYSTALFPTQESYD